MKPDNEGNFLVEITPQVMDDLNFMFKYSDDEPIEVLHYSPYWKSSKTSPSKESENNE